MITKQHYITCVIVPVLLGVWMDVAGEMNIQLIPQHPVIGGSVTLSVTGITGRILSITWFKGPNSSNTNQILVYLPDPGPTTIKCALFHDRMTVSPNGSLMISNLNMTDEGNYTVKIQTNRSNDTHVYMKIYEIVGQPSITASTSLPKENDVVSLTCTSTNAERIVWSRVPSGATLSSDNRTISFSRITRMNSGDYVCEAINPASKRTSDPYTLTVAYGPENVTIGQSLESSVMLLMCSADSVPPPSYQWFNGTYLIVQQNTFHIDVAKLENEWIYTCVVSNPVTKLTATASLNMNVNTASMFCQTRDPSGSGLGVGEIAAIVIGTVFGILILEVVVYFVLKRKRETPRSSIYENAHVPEQHNYEMTLPGAQKKTSEDSNYEQLRRKDKSIYSTIESGKY